MTFLDDFERKVQERLAQTMKLCESCYLDLFIIPFLAAVIRGVRLVLFRYLVGIWQRSVKTGQ